MQTLKVEGMTCAHCERAVTEAIRKVDPKAVVQVDLRAGTVRTDSQAEATRLTDAVQAEGYRARPL